MLLRCRLVVDAFALRKSRQITVKEQERNSKWSVWKRRVGKRTAASVDRHILYDLLCISRTAFHHQLQLHQKLQSVNIGRWRWGERRTWRSLATILAFLEAAIVKQKQKLVECIQLQSAYQLKKGRKTRIRPQLKGSLLHTSAAFFYNNDPDSKNQVEYDKYKKLMVQNAVFFSILEST